VDPGAGMGKTRSQKNALRFSRIPSIKCGLCWAVLGQKQSHRKTAYTNPTMAPPTISHVELTLNRISSTKEVRTIKTVKGSTREDLPNCHVTAAINPRDATFTPSNNPLAHVDLRNRGMIGFEIATKTKEGRNMPSVARNAPDAPPRMNPIKVAVVKTGPGVTWPIATASINCWSVSQPKRITKSAGFDLFS
jgi:hypothetical protein